jgi:hypothetical protein
MACSVGWPRDAAEHVLELQELAVTLLGIHSSAPHRDPTPVHARLAYGKQPGAKPILRSPGSMVRLRTHAGAMVAAAASSVGVRWLAARLGRQ